MFKNEYLSLEIEAFINGFYVLAQMGLLDMLKSGPSIYELRTENGDSKYFIAGSKSQLKSELTVNPFYNQDLEKNYKIYSTISFEAAREQNTFDDLEFAIKNYKANDRIVVVKSK